MKKQNNILSFENLSKFDDVIHGFSSKFFGSMRPSHKESVSSFSNFAKALGITDEKIVRMNQVHSNTVYWAREEDRSHIISKTDGLLTDRREVFLSVVIGDCVPLLMYDPEKKFAAAVHAGWKGLFNEIIKETVSGFIARGSNPQDIIVGIGPCIRSCCYDIAKDHAEKLLEKFPNWKRYIFEEAGKFFLDLPGVAAFQLHSLGIPDSNIEDGDYCTFENRDVYSFRRDGADFGEIIGIIGQI